MAGLVSAHDDDLAVARTDVVMAWLRYVIGALAVVQGGYMVVDGLRALTVGSYITPSSGEHAGQLGPWARAVEVVGLSPDSTVVKSLFVVLGASWIVAAVGAVVSVAWWRPAMLVLAIATLWYAIPGTVISLVVLGLLWWP